MKYYKTKVKVRSGGSVLNFFIVEDLVDRHKMFVLEKASCEWFNNIEVGHILEAVVCSNGKVLSVVGRGLEEIYDDEREFKQKRSKS